MKSFNLYEIKIKDVTDNINGLKSQIKNSSYVKINNNGKIIA